jgi:hypothetical protein
MSSYGQVTASQIASTLPSATLMQNASTSDGSGASLSVAGFATAILSVTASVPMSGGSTINFEASADGSTWVPILGSMVGTTTVAASTTTTGDWSFGIAGYEFLRARISAYSAGTITVKGYACVLSGSQPGGVTSTETDVNVIQIAGSPTSGGNGTADSGTQRVTIASDSAGQIAQTASRMPSATTMQNAATGNGNGTSLVVQGYATAVLNVTASAAMGGGTTINFEATVDDTTWVSIFGTGTTSSGISANTPGNWTFNVAGYKSLRARISAYAQGTITVTGYATVMTGAPAFSGLPAQSSSVLMQSNASQDGNGTPLTVTAYSTAILSVTGSFYPQSAGIPALYFEASSDGSSWVSIAGTQSGTSHVASSTQSTGVWTFDVAGYQQIRARIATNGGSCNLTVNGCASALSGPHVTGGLAGMIQPAILQYSNSQTSNGTPMNVAGCVSAILSATGSFGNLPNPTMLCFEASVDGSLWVPIGGTQIGGALAGSSTTSAGDWTFNVAGYFQIRARQVQGSGGSITVKGYASAASGTPVTSGLAPLLPSVALQYQASAPNDGTAMNVSGCSSAMLAITGTFSCDPIGGSTTLCFEASCDGTSWVPIIGKQLGTFNVATTAQGIGNWCFNVTGFRQMRARLSGYNGYVTVYGYASAGAGSSVSEGPVTATTTYMQYQANQAGTGFPLNVAGFASAIVEVLSSGQAVIHVEGTPDNSNWYELSAVALGAGEKTIVSNIPAVANTAYQVNTVGLVAVRANIVSQTSGTITVVGSACGIPAIQKPLTAATYHFCTPEYTIPATPNDMVVLSGSATRTVKISKIRLYARQTTTAYDTFHLLKRSSANTGGSSVSVTIVPADSGNAAATASAVYYTSNPTVGTLLGDISTFVTVVPTTTAAVGNTNVFELYNAKNEAQPLTLRGTAESIALNFGGVALPAGLKVQLEVTFTEE